MRNTRCTIQRHMRLLYARKKVKLQGIASAHQAYCFKEIKRKEQSDTYDNYSKSRVKRSGWLKLAFVYLAFEPLEPEIA